MKTSLRAVLVAMALLTVVSLLVGTFGARPQATGQTPYVSALSDLAVRPAQAVPCNNLVCAAGPGNHFKCVDEGTLSHCLLSADRRSCQTILPCPG